MKNGTSMARRTGLALLTMLFAVCLSLGLYYTVPKTVRAAEDSAPVAVYVLGASEGDEDGATYFEDKALGWSAAVQKSQELGALVKVILANDWTAAQNAANVTSFGSGAGFDNGGLVVSDADIEFDLNGNVLDRALTNTLNGNGHIFVVKGGALKITGGDSTTQHLSSVNLNPLYIYQDGENTKPVTGGILAGAYGKDGGAVYVEEGSLTVEDVTFIHNAAQNGGAVYANGAAEFYNTLFAENTALEDGGALYATARCDFMDVTFTKNTAGGNGGAVCLLGEENDNLFFTVKFWNNEAKSAGGAVFARDNITLNENIVSGNKAGTFGGGVYIDTAFYMDAISSIISENEAGVSGGGIALNALKNDNQVALKLHGGSVEENSAAVSGGGIFVRDNTQIILEELQIQANTTIGQGGGIYAYSASPSKKIDIQTYANVSVEGNEALTGGGIFLHSNTQMDIDSVRILNNKATQEAGGLFLTGSGGNRAQVSISGETVIKDNVKGTNTASNVGFGNTGCALNVKELALPESATAPQIGLSPIADQLAITSGYKLNNASEGFAADPAKFFFADDGANILLASNGEIATSATAAVWKVNGTAADGYGKAVPYGTTVTSVTLNDGANLLAQSITEVKYENGAVAAYAVEAKTGTTYVTFDVVVLPQQIAKTNVSFTQSITSLSYNGTEQKPEVTVNVGGKALVSGTDFAVTYLNNQNAGTATALVKGTGNYAGEVMLTFEIVPVSNTYNAVIWEYNTTGEWVASSTKPAFVYNGENQGMKIRAKLEVIGIADAADYVYAQGYIPEDKTNWNDNMWISFSGMFAGNPVTEFKNATTYTATVMGTSGANATFPVAYNFTNSFLIQKQNLSVSADTFTAEGAYQDTEGNRLWLVNFNGSKQSLLDGNGLEYVENGAVKYGSIGEVDMYARYRGTELTLELNGNYLVNGTRLEVYLQSAKGIEYVDNTVLGSEGVTVSRTSTVRVTLSDNYQTETGSNLLTITKVWKLVTINNMFTTMGDAEVPAPTNWTYGSQPGIQMLKPQQGNTVIYSFSKTGSGEPENVGSFATLFDAQGAVLFYAVTDKYTANFNRPMLDETGAVIENYFDYFAERLGAGNYVMTARVPRDAAGGVVPITREFNFAVTAFCMSTEQNNFRDEFSYYIRNAAVPYNGNENNVPEIILSFNGRVLVRGVDYELMSSNVNVGSADLTVMGMGGLTGEVTLTGVYEITKAMNGWARIPSIMYWTYHNFDKEINRLSAEPMLLDDAADMWFMVTTDQAGQTPVEGLEKFGLIDGLVSDEAAQKFAALAVGTFYLFARVDGNDNYTALDPAGIEFRVYTAENYWDVTPSIATWITGSYNEDENEITAKSHFGKTKIVVTDEAGNEIYNSETGVNLFATAEVGIYLITATVDETANYSGLSYTATFRVFEKVGLPWWVTLVVVIAVLLVVGIVLFILSKKGVLQVLSGKMVVAIRAKASADATIAAVKANKAAEEAKAALALAEARERIEALRLANEEVKSRPVEEQASLLEERAQEAAKKAERMQKKAARMQKQAASMKAQAAIGAESDIGDPAAYEAAITDGSDED